MKLTFLKTLFISKRSTFIFLFFIISYLFISSCSSESKGARVLIKKEINTYKTTFEMPSKAWVKKTNLVIDSFFQKYIYQDDFSGQFLVAKNGHIIYQRVGGFANKESNWKMSDTTSIHVASISKVLTATAVLRLVDQNKIRLDEKVSYYLPDFFYDGITVRMLLNHRSGLPYYAYFTDTIWPKNTILRNKDILPLMRQYSIPLDHNPGNVFTYCNTNFAFLALIVEAVTKKDFPTVMNELIFEPLKMKNSFILKNQDHFNSASQSYMNKGEKWKFTNLDGVYGDKNFFTTAIDLVLFDNAIYTNFISDSLKRQMFKGYSYEKEGTNNYGLGWRMKEEKEKETYFYHTAWWHGSTGIYARLEKEKMTIISLSNNYSKRAYRISPLILFFGNYPL